jgi:hypothetical protein
MLVGRLAFSSERCSSCAAPVSSLLALFSHFSFSHRSSLDGSGEGACMAAQRMAVI